MLEQVHRAPPVAFLPPRHDRKREQERRRDRHDGPADRWRVGATKSATPQTAATASPIDGRYVYRSAIDWSPACTSPDTGTSIPRNHNHPTSRYGRRRRSAHAAHRQRDHQQDRPRHGPRRPVAGVGVEDRKVRRPERLAQVPRDRHRRVGRPLAERPEFLAAHRPALALQRDRPRRRNAGQCEQRDFLQQQPTPPDHGRGVHRFGPGGRPRPNRRSGHQSSSSRTAGSVTSIVLDISPSAYRTNTAAYRPSPGRRTYRSYAHSVSRKNVAASTSFRSAIHATDSTRSGWTANSAADGRARPPPGGHRPQHEEHEGCVGRVQQGGRRVVPPGVEPEQRHVRQVRQPRDRQPVGKVRRGERPAHAVERQPPHHDRVVRDVLRVVVVEEVVEQDGEVEEERADEQGEGDEQVRPRGAGAEAPASRRGGLSAFAAGASSFRRWRRFPIGCTQASESSSRRVIASAGL